MNKKDFNEVYKKLELKSKELIVPFKESHELFYYKVAYYNGHYHKDNDGNYKMDYYPIPVISIKGYCDIEIEIDEITISTKLKYNDALNFDYSKIMHYDFEMYGVKDYLKDYYVKGNTVKKLLYNIKCSKENEIGVSFKFDKNIESEIIYHFVLFLKSNGFYY